MRTRWQLRCGVLLVAFQLLTVAAKAHPLDHWHVRYTNAPNVPFNGVAFGNSLFVAVGPSGMAATSPDGQNWTTNFPTTNTLNAVTFGNGQFVAVGLQSTILTSTNGSNWVLRNYDPAKSLINVKYGNSMFVAIGVAGFTMVSGDDGVTWSVQNSTSLTQNKPFAFGNGLFLRPEFKGTNLLTMDGTNWWRQYTGTNLDLYTAGFENGMFVGISVNNNYVFTSATASNWTFQGTIPLVRAEEIAFGNGHWVVVSRGGPPAYSADLIHWHGSSTPYSASSVTFGNGTFVGAYTRIIQSDPVLNLQFGADNHLLLHGPTNVFCSIQATDDPGDSNSWQTVANILLDTSPLDWSDPEIGNHPNRFYRAVLP